MQSKKWNDQVLTLKMCHTFREMQGLDGEPIDFEWKIFQELQPQHWTPSTKIQADSQGKHITLENFSDPRIFMTMFNDIVLEKKTMKILCSYFKEDQRIRIKF